VLAVELPDKDVLLLHQGSRQYFSLNRTGSLIWKMIESSASPAAIRQTLTDRFEVTPEAAGAAIGDLLADLQRHKLITLSEPRPPL
jgi:hypothetical protein